ncbi:hypothetical protein HW571_18720 [Agrobacterium genomosp. 3]|uniref:hypothetical protein n=1 Tax=Rhizobium/Agrobacterium group TaxID=227290 RepID=UPI0002170A62|nr:hypothetical protein [Rhizobium sp. AN80A]EGP54152.1 hypothetical protein Agau_P200417 [Agrobacterium tumefaciens F2]MCA1867716.1 hypothetical protein [Agrobacterium tomkonis]MCA1878121.1 hypothetical protein [Agrobacterium tumefaciens]
MVLDGVGSLWLVTGEKDEPKHVLEDLEELPDFSVPMVSTLSSTIRASSEFELPATVEAFNLPGHFKTTTFVTVTRILAAYSARDIDFEEVVRRLREGRFEIPSREIIAIEVSKGDWLTSHFIRLPSGSYGLSPDADPRALPVKTIENKPDSMKLPSGLLIFLSEPRWSLATEKDVRPEHEVLESAERWLGRSTLAVESAPGDANAVDLLRHHVATTVNDDEKADIAAAARLLAGRQSILDIMPQILAKDPAFQKRVQEFELQEQERLKERLRSKVESEIEAEKARLGEIRAEIAEADARLAVAGQRELLLRNEAEKHDEVMKARIEEAAKQLQGGAIEQTDHLRRELDELRDLVLQMPSHPTTVVVSAAEEIPEPQRPDVNGTAVGPKADEGARKSILAGLASATGISQAHLMAILLKSTDEVPLLVGERASGVAADIVAAIGGEDSAVAFCDPSRISWQDLMHDETSGLAAAVAKAKANPDILVPIAICGITNGPCEYWLPQFVESRRIGRLPRNLAIVASAGIDGSRVSIPDSVLRFLMPVEVPNSAKPVRRLFAGSWPAEFDANRSNLADAIDVLTQSEAFENGSLQRAAKTLSRTPQGMAMAEVAQPLVRQAQWLASVSGGGQYEFKNRFKNIEG